MIERRKQRKRVIDKRKESLNYKKERSKVKEGNK